MNDNTEQSSSSSSEALMSDSSAVGSGRKKHVLLGCTGSVASVKIPILVQELLNTQEVKHRQKKKLLCWRNGLLKYRVGRLVKKNYASDP